MSPHTPSDARRRPWYNWLWRYGRLFLVAYLVVLLLLMFLEESMIFIPTRSQRAEPHPPGLVIEDAWFQAADGTKLHGWYAPHARGRAAILFCHGNAGNVTHRDDVIRRLRDITGASVLVFDYRGYGQSEGQPTEAGVLADARAARAWLAQRENRAESDIVLMGESLGGGVAVDLAAADGARALVLECTFNRLPDVAAHYFPYVPVRWLMRTRLDSEAKIRNYRGPLLQSHGECDSIIPVAFGRRLFEAANQPKQWLDLPGCDHNDPRPAWYYQKLGEFLDGRIR